MARVTVEDCAMVPKFELVILAAERARNISSGAPLTVDRDNDKDPVIALREIAAKTIDPLELRSAHTSRLRKNNNIEDIAEETVHAETQESTDYTPESEEDMFAYNIEHDLSDMVEDMDFSDNISEEDESSLLR